MRLLAVLCAIVACLASSRGTTSPPLQVVVRPEEPFVEQRNGRQIVNFDLLVRNESSTAYELVGLKISVFDRAERLEVERELSENRHPPALNVVGERRLAAGSAIDIFQPFVDFGPEVELGRIHVDCLFNRAGHAAAPVALSADAIASINVRPRAYTPESFVLPLHGLLLVHDGHDFYSHHRRFNLAARFLADPVSAVSPNLYAYDFMRVTPDGELFTGSALRKESWLTYGEEIYAPAAARVIKVVSDVEENTFDAQTGEAQVPVSMNARDPEGFGNYVELRHADGRVSWLLHMQPHSIRVHVGERVAAGDWLGKVGFSGDSLFPHLHYNVTSGEAYPSQGVPSAFGGYVRVMGSRQIAVCTGQVDSGDLLLSAEGICPR